MKTPVAVLIISLLHLPAAELQQEPECNIPKMRQVDVSFSCTGKEQLCLPVVAAKEVGAKVEDSEGKLEDLQPASEVSDPEYMNITLTHRTDVQEADRQYLTKGIFTAAAKGVYYFRFFGQDVANESVGAQNHEGLTLTLEEGEQVHISLRSPSARFHLHFHIHFHIHIHVHIHFHVRLW